MQGFMRLLNSSVDRHSPWIKAILVESGIQQLETKLGIWIITLIVFVSG